MTLLGKVFTILLALLSVIFFTLAVAVNASHLNYRKLVKDPKTGYEAKVKDLEEKVRQLTKGREDDKSKLSIEQTARRSALNALQTQLDQKEKEVTDQNAELLKVLASNADLVKTEQASIQELKARTADNDLLRKQLVESREDRNQTFARMVKSVDDLSRLQGMHQSQNERLQQLASDYTSAKEKLEILGIKPNTLLESAPAVNGKVVAVSTSGLVEVSLGQDSGMREGFTLDAHRNGQYLGKLKVKTVAAHASVCEIMQGFQTGYIREGDRVDSKLY